MTTEEQGALASLLRTTDEVKSVLFSFGCTTVKRVNEDFLPRDRIRSAEAARLPPRKPSQPPPRSRQDEPSRHCGGAGAGAVHARRGAVRQRSRPGGARVPDGREGQPRRRAPRSSPTSAAQRALRAPPLRRGAAQRSGWSADSAAR